MFSLRPDSGLSNLLPLGKTGFPAKSFSLSGPQLLAQEKDPHTAILSLFLDIWGLQVLVIHDSGGFLHSFSFAVLPLQQAISSTSWQEPLFSGEAVCLGLWIPTLWAKKKIAMRSASSFSPRTQQKPLFQGAGTSQVPQSKKHSPKIAKSFQVRGLLLSASTTTVISAQTSGLLHLRRS